MYVIFHIQVQAMGTKENDSYILDMSTSSVAVGKIEIQLRKNEPLPSKGIKNFP